MESTPHRRPVSQADRFLFYAPLHCDSAHGAVGLGGWRGAGGIGPLESLETCDGLVIISLNLRSVNYEN